MTTLQLLEQQIHKTKVVGSNPSIHKTFDLNRLIKVFANIGIQTQESSCGSVALPSKILSVSVERIGILAVNAHS